MNSAITSSRMHIWLVWAALALVIVGSVMLHVPALSWLSGAAATADFSFHRDERRFVSAARDFRAPIARDGYPQGMAIQLYFAESGAA